MITYYKPIIRHKANNDLVNAYTWYESEQPQLGERFINAVKQKLDIICRAPLIYRSSYKNYREAILSDFPYVIIYYVDDIKQSVIVMAVFHTSRNPKKKPR